MLLTRMSHEPHELFGWLRRDGIAVAESPIGDFRSSLMQEEQAAVAHAVRERQYEFSTGRRLARLALNALGEPAGAIGMGRDRQPLWPAGICGSITHAGGWCAAVVARRSALKGSVGIDLEPAEPLPEDIEESVCTHAEAVLLAELEPGIARVAARCIFSAKESIYKAQYAQTGRYLDMLDVSVVLHPEMDRFTATLLIDAAPFPRGHEWSGRLSVTSRFIATAAILDDARADARPGPSGKARPFSSAVWRE